MTHLITTTEIRTLGRPIGKIADDKLNAFITEAEQLHIKPILGDDLYLKLLKEVEETDESKRDPDRKMLLAGGSYYTDEGTENEEIHSFMGLKVVISYFVYAQNLMVGDIESTRYGSVIKNGDYSNQRSAQTLTTTLWRLPTVISGSVWPSARRKALSSQAAGLYLQ